MLDLAGSFEAISASSHHHSGGSNLVVALELQQKRSPSRDLLRCLRGHLCCGSRKDLLHLSENSLSCWHKIKLTSLQVTVGLPSVSV